MIKLSTANKGDIFYHKDEYYVATGSDLGNVWTNGYVEPDAAGGLWWNTQSNGGIVKVTGRDAEIISLPDKRLKEVMSYVWVTGAATFA